MMPGANNFLQKNPDEDLERWLAPLLARQALESRGSTARGGVYRI